MLADALPAPDANVITFLYGLCGLAALITAVFGAILTVRKVMYPSLARGEQFVTKAELAESTEILDKRIDNVKSEIMDRIRNLDTYIHERAHAQDNVLQRVLLKLQTIIVRQEI